MSQRREGKRARLAEDTLQQSASKRPRPNAKLPVKRFSWNDVSQLSHEEVKLYCDRVLDLFAAAGGADRVSPADKLADDEQAHLLNVIGCFIDGLDSSNLKKRMLHVSEVVPSHEVSLGMFCATAIQNGARPQPHGRQEQSMSINPLVAHHPGRVTTALSPEIMPGHSEPQPKSRIAQAEPLTSHARGFTAPHNQAAFDYAQLVDSDHRQDTPSLVLRPASQALKRPVSVKNVKHEPLSPHVDISTLTPNHGGDASEQNRDSSSSQDSIDSSDDGRDALLGEESSVVSDDSEGAESAPDAESDLEEDDTDEDVGAAVDRKINNAVSDDFRVHMVNQQKGILSSADTAMDGILQDVQAIKACMGAAIGHSRMPRTTLWQLHKSQTVLSKTLPHYVDLQQVIARSHFPVLSFLLLERLFNNDGTRPIDYAKIKKDISIALWKCSEATRFKHAPRSFVSDECPLATIHEIVASYWKAPVSHYLDIRPCNENLQPLELSPITPRVCAYWEIILESIVRQRKADYEIFDKCGFWTLHRRAQRKLVAGTVVKTSYHTQFASRLSPGELESAVLEVKNYPDPFGRNRLIEAFPRVIRVQTRTKREAKANPSAYLFFETMLEAWQYRLQMDGHVLAGSKLSVRFLSPKIARTFHIDHRKKLQPRRFPFQR